LEDYDVDGKIILKCIFMRWDGGRDWIYLAEDRDKWWALVNA
jgi:hypothetical protein